MSKTRTNASGGAFLTQNGEKLNEVKHEINELEQLLAAAGQTSQSTLLLKKRKEMREVDQSLDNMKNQHKQRMDACEERRVQFEAKQAKMREQVLRFEKFIQENDAKRQRAEGKAKQERKLYEDKLKEINALTDKIRSLELEQSQLTNLLVTNGCYKVYLERIVEEGEFGYEEISEILNRHNTLREANADLMQHSAQLEYEVDEFRKNLSSIKTEKQNQLLVNTSIIQDLQNEYEKIQQHVKEKEEENIQKENKKKDISRELSQTTQAIRNLFGRCFNTMRIKPVFTTNTGTIVTPSQQQHNTTNNNTTNNNTTNNKENSTSMLEILDYELDIILMRISDLVEISNEYKYAVENGLTSSSSMDLRENSTISMQTASKSII